MMKNDSIKREQSDACIDSAERENYRTKGKIMIIDGGPRKNMNTAAMIEADASCLPRPCISSRLRDSLRHLWRQQHQESLRRFESRLSRCKLEGR